MGRNRGSTAWEEQTQAAHRMATRAIARKIEPNQAEGQNAVDRRGIFCGSCTEDCKGIRAAMHQSSGVGAGNGMMKISADRQGINNFVGEAVGQELVEPAAKLFAAATPFPVVCGGGQELQLRRAGTPEP